MFKKINSLWSKQLTKISSNKSGSENAGEVHSKPASILTRQILRLGTIIITIMVAFVIVNHFLSRKGNKAKDLGENKEEHKILPISAAGDAIDPEKMWRNHFEDKLTENSNKISQQLQVIEDSMKRKEEEITGRTSKELAEMEEKLKFAREELQEVISELKAIKEQEIRKEPSEPESKSNITSHLISDEREIGRPKNSRNFIPETSYVGGVLLGGITVSTAVGSSSEPVPVVIRLTNRGNLPAGFAVDLKGCRILGSSYGDLSSERAVIRAEILVCQQGEQIITTKVAGIVYGDDGSNGIKGKVVQTSNKHVQNALIGGVLAGFANTAKGADQFNITSLGAVSTKKVGVGERLRDNSLAGVGNAGEKLADYFLRQAEMMSPVLQIPGGTRVDVVFTKGVYLGSQGIRREIAKAREESINE